MDFLSKVAASLVSLVVTPIIKHVTYPFKVGKNVKKLDSATKKLVALKKDTESNIENAKRERGVPTNSVNVWLSQVEDIEKEASEILENYQQPRRCLFNLCPNIRKNYSISRRAAKKLVDVERQNGEKKDIIETTHQPPPLAQEMAASLATSHYLSTALDHIRDHEADAIIGIWGMGGVGKTHLLKQINNKLCEGHAFDVVTFVTCSKECSEEKIQDQIIEKLKLQKTENTELKAGLIYNFLRERSFVLLLDDLWNRVDLETIGIPSFRMVERGSKKIILTTRSEEVCGQMEVTNKIKVNVLDTDQSWSLFKEKVTEETFNSHPLIKTKYAKIVMKELGGLPLALITVGRAMHGKTNPSEWEYAITQLQKARLDEIDMRTVFCKLEFSYDNLRTDALKECFLVCSLWPEDFVINVNEQLIPLWMGLGLLDDPEIEKISYSDTYNIGWSRVRRLHAACLLEAMDPRLQWVKMHDVIRDMALWIASNHGVEKNRWIVQGPTNVDFIEVKSETEKISLIKSKIKELSLCNDGPSTKLSTLLIHSITGPGGEEIKEIERRIEVEDLCLDASEVIRTSTKQEIEEEWNLYGVNPSLLFQLTFLDLSFTLLKEFPVVVCKLINLQHLNLSYNRIKSLPKELDALINLRYLILRMCGIRIIPYGIVSALKALRVLDLRYCDIIGEHIPALLQELQCLGEFQALGILIGADMLQFEKFLEVANVPIRWLRVSVQHEQCSYILNNFLGKNQLRSNLFKLEMHGMSVEWVEFESSNEISSDFERLDYLSFIGMDSLKEVRWKKSVDAKDVLSRLRILVFWCCEKLRSISWVVHLPSIQEITIDFCQTIEQLIYEGDLKDSELEVSKSTFPSLRVLRLVRLDALESICDPKITFPALESLEVDDCPSLKWLPFNTNNIPGNLTKIEGYEEWWNSVQWEDTSVKSSLQPVFQKRQVEEGVQWYL